MESVAHKTGAVLVAVENYDRLPFGSRDFSTKDSTHRATHRYAHTSGRSSAARADAVIGQMRVSDHCGQQTIRRQQPRGHITQRIELVKKVRRIWRIGDDGIDLADEIIECRAQVAMAKLIIVCRRSGLPVGRITSRAIRSTRSRTQFMLALRKVPSRSSAIAWSTGKPECAVVTKREPLRDTAVIEIEIG